MATRWVPWFCILTLCCTASCWKRPRQRARVERLNDRVRLLELKLFETHRDLESRLRDLEAAMNRLEARLGDLERTDPPTPNGTTPGATPAEPAPRRGDGPSQGPVKNQAATKPSPPPEPPPDPPQTADPEAKPPIAADQVPAYYREGLRLLEAGQIAAAKQHFFALLEHFPQHALAPNAQYWLGEAEYDLENYNTAILAFQKVSTNYPQSAKVPDALLKIGKCWQRLGQLDRAREYFQRVPRDYPRSRAAKLARSWL